MRPVIGKLPGETHHKIYTLIGILHIKYREADWSNGYSVTQFFAGIKNLFSKGRFQKTFLNIFF